MAETLNKRLQIRLDAEARENARRYWAKKAGGVGTTQASDSADTSQSMAADDAQRSEPNPSQGTTKPSADTGDAT